MSNAIFKAALESNGGVIELTKDKRHHIYCLFSQFVNDEESLKRY